jgi:hypothetical protein
MMGRSLNIYDEVNYDDPSGNSAAPGADFAKLDLTEKVFGQFLILNFGQIF